MKTISKFFLLLLLINSIISCQKEETTPTPVVTPTPLATYMGCRIDAYESQEINSQNVKFKYDSEGRVISTQTTYTGSSSLPADYAFTYKDGLLVSVKDAVFEENYDYINGALSKIRIVKSSESNYRGYEIAIETDVNKRIVKMTDTFDYQNILKRDDKGNLTEIKMTRLGEGKEVYRMVRSDFDNKKAIYEFFKGWSFDITQYYGDYMKNPTFTVGAGGNPRKMQIYLNGSMSEDWEYTYTYNQDGYPIKIDALNKVTNRVLTTVLSYKDCK